MTKDIGALIDGLLDVLNSLHREMAAARQEIALMKERLAYRENEEDTEANESPDHADQDDTWTQRKWRIKGQNIWDDRESKARQQPGESGPASDAQIELLDKEGVDFPPELTRSQADEMIDALWRLQKK